MNNYFSDFIWKADIIFSVFVLILITGIVCYTGFKSYFENARIRKLRMIKEHVFRLVSTNVKATSDQEALLTKNISARTFLDVATNRVREEVFFNRSEQELFEKKYISQENLEKLRLTAGKSLNKWRRIEASLALGYAGVDTCLDILKSNLFSQDEDISYFSALALCQIRNVDSARALLQFLKKRPAYCYKIASLLGQFPPQIASEVIGLTCDKDPSFRVWAVRIMADIRGLSYTDQIIKMAQDESAEVRAAVCQFMGVTGNKDSIKILEGCLKDDAWLVRAQAVEALEKLKGEKCVERVISLLRDNSWLVIDRVKEVLIKHIDTAIDYLEKTFAGQDVLVKRIAVEIIELSGYTEKLYRALFETGANKQRAVFILKEMFKAGAGDGLDPAIFNFNEEQNRRILEVIKAIDPRVAER